MMVAASHTTAQIVPANGAAGRTISRMRLRIRPLQLIARVYREVGSNM